METFFRNIRFALRTFRRQPAAYAFAILVLACGIGIGTTVFSLVQAVLLRPLPFPDQDALSIIWKTDRKTGDAVVELAYPELHDLEDSVPALSSVALMPTTLYGYGKVIQIAGRRPVQVESTPVSHNFFRTLGVAPALGRDFNSADEFVGAPPVVLLSDGVWRDQFDADPHVIGRLVTLNGTGYTVIGVMQRAVDFPRGAGLWVPLHTSADLDKRGATYLEAIARIRPGATREQADAQITTLFQRLARQYPQFYSRSQEALITPLARYWTGPARLQLIFSLSAALLLLITACITASNLFLSRAMARTQEMATRSSVGAGASQILGQFVAEGLTAGAIAGAAGVLIAFVLIRVLILLGPADIPRLQEASLNLPVLLFTAAMAMLTALACSAAPALLATRSNLEALLRSGGNRLTGGRGGRRLQNLFTIGQTTVTLVLLTASVLIVISVHAMLTADIGFSNREAVTMNLALRGDRYSDEQRDRFYTQLLNNLRKSPGVRHAAGVLLRPLEGTIGWDMRYVAAFNRDKRPEDLPLSNYETVTPGYFATVGIPLLEGRDFNDGDKRDAMPTVIISRSLANRFRAIGRDPIGERLDLGQHRSGPGLTIVGVVGDTRDRGVTATGDDIYVPYQQTGIPVNYVVITGDRSARELTALVARQLAALDPTQTIAGAATIAELVDRDTARQRFNMAILLTFGAGALLLAAAGVYSVVAEAVAVRTREIGIRMAVGANSTILVRHLIAATIRFVVIGELTGLACAVVLGRFVSGVLYEVKPGDPVVLISVTCFLLAVSLLAASIPALQASRMEPAEALR